jgi:hypothetical protein
MQLTLRNSFCGGKLFDKFTNCYQFDIRMLAQSLIEGFQEGDTVFVVMLPAILSIQGNIDEPGLV